MIPDGREARTVDMGATVFQARVRARPGGRRLREAPPRDWLGCGHRYDGRGVRVVERWRRVRGRRALVVTSPLLAALVPPPPLPPPTAGNRPTPRPLTAHLPHRQPR